MEKKGFKMPSAFSILFIIIAILAVITHLIPSVKSASIADFVMAAPTGFVQAIDVCVFVLCIGGFLGVVADTGALDAGIAAVVKKMNGNELMLIPVLMLIFSLGGTSYGMCEETMAFYVLIVGTMMVAGFDAMVGCATILLGAGVGCLGSTVNPFAVGAAADELKNAGIKVNQTIIIGLGAILWLSSLLIAIIFVMRYAKKVKSEGRSILTAAEKAASEAEYLSGKSTDTVQMTTSQKITLVLFGLSFVIMIISLIPWADFGVSMPYATGKWLVGQVWGDWYFQELQAWFTIMAIIIAIVSRMPERDFIKNFINGAADMMSVVLIIAVARGISVLMKATGLDMYVLDNAAKALSGVNTTVFTAGSYIVYIGLSFLIPSTSGLAGASMGTFGPLAVKLGLSPEVMVMIYCAACGVVNLITPTSAVVMGGTSLSKIEYPTWLKFALPLCGILVVANIIILSIAMMVL
ncbi:Uncharacterized membrane protein YfcC, ion transporter superfamily [Lachnospiraceae bacterium XBB1006]|nr:Uncharacterized membrane protein YfcC, ion transporter superfamily [Lachnospiraceae bacterium XBB1006]